MRGKARDILILKRITDFSITGSAALKCRNNGRKFNIYKICHYLGVKIRHHPHVVTFGGSLFSSPCQRQCVLLSSLGVRCPLTFHILIFSK